MNPLDSIPGTIGAGFVLTVVLYFVVKNACLVVTDLPLACTQPKEDISWKPY